MKRALAVVAGGTVGLLAQFAIVYALLSGDDVLGAFTVVALGAMILGGLVAFVTRKPLLCVTMILCGSIGALAGAYLLDRFRDVERQLVPSNIVRDVALDRIQEHPPGRVVYLQDSEVRADLMGRAVIERRRGGKKDRHVRVAPIVPPGWTTSDPVPAWAVFLTNESTFGGYAESEGLAEWAKPNRAGFVVAPAKYYETAIADAEQTHRIFSVFAPLIEWRDPAAERAERRNRFVLALLATHAVWLAAAISWALQVRKSAIASA